MLFVHLYWTQFLSLRVVLVWKIPELLNSGNLPSGVAVADGGGPGWASYGSAANMAFHPM